MKTFVDAGAGVVRAGRKSWRFTLDAAAGRLEVRFGKGRVRVGSLTWQQRLGLARFAHLGSDFVSEALVQASVVGKPPKRLSARQRRALWRLASWLNLEGSRLPNDTRVLARVTLDLCRGLHLAPADIDALGAFEVEELWHESRRAPEVEAPAPAESPRVVRQSALPSLGPEATQILVVADPDATEAQPQDAEAAETAEATDGGTRQTGPGGDEPVAERQGDLAGDTARPTAAASGLQARSRGPRSGEPEQRPSHGDEPGRAAAEALSRGGAPSRRPVVPASGASLGSLPSGGRARRKDEQTAGKRRTPGDASGSSPREAALEPASKETFPEPGSSPSTDGEAGRLPAARAVPETATAHPRGRERFRMRIGSSLRDEPGAADSPFESPGGVRAAAVPTATNLLVPTAATASATASVASLAADPLAGLGLLGEPSTAPLHAEPNPAAAAPLSESAWPPAGLGAAEHGGALPATPEGDVDVQRVLSELADRLFRAAEEMGVEVED